MTQQNWNQGPQQQWGGPPQQGQMGPGPYGAQQWGGPQQQFQNFQGQPPKNNNTLWYVLIGVAAAALIGLVIWVVTSSGGNGGGGGTEGGTGGGGQQQTTGGGGTESGGGGGGGGAPAGSKDLSNATLPGSVSGFTKGEEMSADEGVTADYTNGGTKIGVSITYDKTGFEEVRESEIVQDYQRIGNAECAYIEFPAILVEEEIDKVPSCWVVGSQGVLNVVYNPMESTDSAMSLKDLAGLSEQFYNAM